MLLWNCVLKVGPMMTFCIFFGASMTHFRYHTTYHTSPTRPPWLRESWTRLPTILRVISWDCVLTVRAMTTFSNVFNWCEYDIYEWRELLPTHCLVRFPLCGPLFTRQQKGAFMPPFPWRFWIFLWSTWRSGHLLTSQSIFLRATLKGGAVAPSAP